MPRDGSGIYSRPPGTDGAPDTTIESAKYNSFVADIEQDANTPRPVIAGGTGAVNKRDAMIELGGEIANQDVTNYDSFPFVTGSFSSLSTATAGPGVAVTGNCVIHSDPLFATLRAHETGSASNPGKSFIREKKAGVWQAWKADGTTSVTGGEGIGVEGGDMFFGVTGASPNSQFVVNTESDATGTNTYMASRTGGHFFNSIPSSYTLLTLGKSGAGMGVGFQGVSSTGVGRWLMYLGEGTAESGANAGSNFEVHRYSDAGAHLGRVVHFDRANGNASFGNTVYANGNVSAGAALTAGADAWIGQTSAGSSVRFTAAGTVLLNYDGGKFNLGGGDLHTSNSIKVGGEVIIGHQATTAVLRFTNDTGRYFWWNGTAWSIAGGDFNVSHRLVASSDIHTGSSFAFGGVGTVKYMQESGGNLNVNNMTLKPNSGLSMGGGQILPLATSGALQTGSGGGLEVRSDGASDAWMTFHRPSNFACNFGLCNDHNLYYGGYSFGATQYRILTTRDGGAVAGVRTTYAGDHAHVYPTEIEEPFGSAVTVTGGKQGWDNITMRYRTLQQNIGGSWGTIGST